MAIKEVVNKLEVLNSPSHGTYIKCIFDEEPAIGIFYLNEGCLCKTDIIQALCEHHAHRVTPGDEAKLLLSLKNGQLTLETIPLDYRIRDKIKQDRS